MAVLEAVAVLTLLVVVAGAAIAVVAAEVQRTTLKVPVVVEVLFWPPLLLTPVRLLVSKQETVS